MPRKLEFTVLELIESSAKNIKTLPMNLGGVSGADGGAGGPPGGYIGLLPQYQVAYDTTEAATLATVASGTLVDNLNHIRYRLGILEAGSGVLTVEEADGSPSVNNVDKIIFSGATVTNLGGGDVLVTISGGTGGGGSPLTVEDLDESVSNVTTIVFPQGELVDNGSGEVEVRYTYPTGRVMLTDATTGAPTTQPWLEWNSSDETIEFGADVAGKETNAGKIGYEAFGAGHLHIVGAGTSAPNRSVKIYDNLDVDNQLTVGGVAIDTAKLVTNGDSHDHFGGDGGQVNHTALGNIGIYSHDAIDEIIETLWIPRTETWTRTGNHTFTISGDYTGVFTLGAKVRYKDGGAFEYGVVKSSSVGGGTTTVTLVENTSYTMAAATITDTYVSYGNPADFPALFSYTPTYTGSTSGTPTVTTNSAYWTLLTTGVMAVFVSCQITAVGTAVGTLGISYPFTTSVGAGSGRENAVTGNMLQVQAQSTRMILFTYNNGVVLTVNYAPIVGVTLTFVG